MAFDLVFQASRLLRGGCIGLAVALENQETAAVRLGPQVQTLIVSATEAVDAGGSIQALAQIGHWR